MTTTDEPVTSRVGRPSSYKPEFADQAEKLCLLGCTDKDLADFFDVSETTINNWKNEFPEFLVSIKAGKTIADAEVASKLNQRARGYEWTEEQAIKIKTGQYEERVEIVEVRREVPPDPTSAIFWLKNRRKADWSDKVIQEHSGPDGGPIQTSDTETVRKLAFLLARADKETS